MTYAKDVVTRSISLRSCFTS